MKLADVAKNAFAMPLTTPPIRAAPTILQSEFVVISYRTDPDALREVVPEPLRWCDTVNYEFIRMPIRPLWRLYGNRPGHPRAFPHAGWDGPGRRYVQPCISTTIRRSPRPRDLGLSEKLAQTKDRA